MPGAGSGPPAGTMPEMGDLRLLRDEAAAAARPAGDPSAAACGSAAAAAAPAEGWSTGALEATGGFEPPNKGLADHRRHLLTLLVEVTYDLREALRGHARCRLGSRSRPVATGPGYFVRRPPRDSRGDPRAIARRGRDAGLSTLRSCWCCGRESREFQGAFPAEIAARR